MLIVLKVTEFVEEVHDKGMTIGVYFYVETNNTQYYNLFEVGVDVIITDYPIRVANQLNDYNSNSIELEVCKNKKKKITIISIVNLVI